MNAFKLKNAFLMSLCALTAFFVSSCTNEEDEKEKSSKLSLTISGSTEGVAKVSERSTGATGVESTINRIAVGVFNSDGSTNAIAEFEYAELTVSGSDLSTSMTCTPGTGCSVVIVANAPAGLFSGDNTKADFIAELVDLQQTANVATTDQLSTNLPMSGEATSILFEAGDGTDVSVSLSRLVSKVTLNSVSTAFEAGGQYADATFKVTKVFLYNSLQKSKVDAGNSAATFPGTPTYYHGGTTTIASPFTWTDGTDFVLDKLASDFSVTTLTPYVASHFFYTLPNPSTNATKTKLVIAGLFDQDGAGTTYSEEAVYYPIVINKNQTGTSITEGGVGKTGRDGYIDRNNIYNLSATIKGKGTGNPVEDIEPADLNLTVSVADWALTVVQDVVFE